MTESLKLDDVLDQNDIKPDYTTWDESYIDVFLSNEDLTPWLLLFYQRFENVPNNLTLSDRKFVGMTIQQYTNGTDMTLIFKQCVFEECVFYSSDNLYVHFTKSNITDSVFQKCERFLFSQSKITSSQFLEGNLNWFHQSKIQDSIFEKVTFSQDNEEAYEQVSIHNCKYHYCEFENIAFQKSDLDTNQIFSCKGSLTFLETIGCHLVFDKNEKMTLDFIDSKISDLHVVRHHGEMTFKRSDLKEVKLRNNKSGATFRDSYIMQVDSGFNRYPFLDFYDSTVLNWKSSIDQFIAEIRNSSLQEVELSSIQKSSLNIQNSKLKLWKLSENELEFKIKESHLESIASFNNFYNSNYFQNLEITQFLSQEDKWMRAKIGQCKINDSIFKGEFHHSIWKYSSLKDTVLKGNFLSNVMEEVTLYKSTWEGSAKNLILKNTQIDSSLLQIHLTESEIIESIISQSEWVRTSFHSVKIEDSLFDHVIFRNIIMSDMSWHNSTIKQTKMNAPLNSTFENSLIQDSRVYGTFLNNKILNVKILDTKFLGDLLDTSAQNCNLLNVSFHDDLLNVSFHNSNMQVSRFYGNLLHTSFKSCDLSYSSLEEYRIEQTLFEQCDLNKTSFLGAVLLDTRFSECSNFIEMSTRP